MAHHAQMQVSIGGLECFAGETIHFVGEGYRIPETGTGIWNLNYENLEFEHCNLIE